MGKRMRMLGQYGSNPYLRAAAGTVNLIRSAAPYAKKAYSAIRTIQKRKRTVTPMVSSFQHDNVPRYNYKRMPARKRRVWKRFIKKVRHVDLQMQPLHVYTKKTLNAGTTAANVGNSFGYMIGGTTVTNNDELYQMFKGAYNVASAAACAPYKIYLKSLVLDMMITNTSTTTVILDVYRLQCKKDYATASQLATQFNAAIGEVAADATAGTLTATDISTTVFDAPNFCSYWKVLSKREVILGSGQTTTMQMRKPSNKYIDGKLISQNVQALPGYTEAFFIMWHGAPDATPNFSATAITVGTALVGHYAVPPGSLQTETGRTG